MYMCRKRKRKKQRVITRQTEKDKKTEKETKVGRDFKKKEKLLV